MIGRHYRSRMARLSEFTVGSIVRGVPPNEAVTMRHIQPHGEQAASITYVDGQGRVATSVGFQGRDLSVVLGGLSPADLNRQH
jgi:hypothetical protein